MTNGRCRPPNRQMSIFSAMLKASSSSTPRYLTRQKRHRLELIDPKIAAHGGSIIKLTGDGMIAEFPSVVEAVQCAVSIQLEMEAREAEEPEDRRILYRVAVNLGDVIFDEGDVYGDGVNIAARLETLSEPGGVVVSGTAYDHLKQNIDVGYEDLGEQRVKNIAIPVRAYSVVLDSDHPGGIAFSKGFRSRVMSSVRRSRIVAAVAVIVGIGIGLGIAAKIWLPGLEPASVGRMAYLRELGVSLLHQAKYEETVATMRRVMERETDVTADIQTLVSALGHLGQTEGVAELIRLYDGLAIPSYFDPFTAEESLLWWYGDMFSYHPAFRQHLYEGLVKAGVPSAAGDDLDMSAVWDQVTQVDGVFFVRDLPRITIEEAQALWKDKAAVFVDVRAVLDFEAGHIPGSVNLSLLVGMSRETLLKIASPDDILVFSCHGPHCPYSAYGAAKAKLWGFSQARYFPGGFPAWEEADLPVDVTKH